MTEVLSTSADTSKSSGSNSARFIGSSIAGISELILFHPVDTVAKRLMSTETKLVVFASPSMTATNFNQAIFREAANKSILSKFGGLFPGIGFGGAYKILQRVYKFGGQPIVLDIMKKRWGRDMEDRFGIKTSKTLLSATAGSIIGVGEIVLLPLDALKIKAQTAPDQLKGRGVVDIFVKEGASLYRGAGWTAARNAPGSFALFGGNAAAKSFMGIDEGQQATWAQDAIASCSGAIASIAIAQPLDVIKTRIQNRPFDSPESGASILTKLIKNEGIGGFFKGLTPKIIVVGPKLVFSFTVAQHSSKFIAKVLISMSAENRPKQTILTITCSCIFIG